MTLNQTDTNRDTNRITSLEAQNMDLEKRLKKTVAENIEQRIALDKKLDLANNTIKALTAQLDEMNHTSYHKTRYGTMTRGL